MSILLKYLIRNIKEKKIRTFLILISVAMTSGLFFTSLAITDTISEINLEMHRSMVGNSDIRIFPKDNEEGEPYIDLSGVGKVSDLIEYGIGTLDGSALYEPSKEEMIYVTMVGTTLEDLEINNPITFRDVQQGEEFDRNQLIISEMTAEKYQLSLGDTMELEFGSHKKQFEIFGIAKLKGIFLAEGSMTSILIPKITLSEIYELDNQVNNIYIKLDNAEQLDEVLQKLQLEYPDCEVTEALDSSDLQQSMNEIELPLKLVTIFIIIMCIFIVYTAFKIISIERLPNIGTFRSIGATKKMTGRILILESLFYGAVGGIAGVGIGLAALLLITKVMVTDISKNNTLLPDFSPIYLLFTFLFAVVLSYISAMLPIHGIFKIPTKELILNQTYKESKRHIVITFIAIFLLIVSIFLPNFIPENPLLVLIIDDICVIMILFALVMLLPVIIRVMVPILEKIFSIIGKDGVLAAKNLRNNKNILNITGLLVIGISTLIMISSINQSIIDEILNLFSKTFKYDIQLVYKNADQNFINELQATDRITDATGIIINDDLKFAGTEDSINCVYGIDPGRFLNHWNFDIPEDTIGKLTQGRTIILGSTVLEKLGLKVGDNINLDFTNGIKTYQIIGSFDTLWDSGSIGLISDENMLRDSDYAYYSRVYVRANRPAEELQKELQAKYLRNLTYNRTRSEDLTVNTEGVDRVFKILKSYTQLTMLIGIIGIINNLIVSFMERRRSFAMYRSIGMSRLQLKKMIILEALSGGIIGGAIGLLAAGLMLIIMPDIMKQIMGPMDMTYSLPLFMGYFGVGIIIMLISSVIPAMKSSKLSIIETIKYE